MISGSLPWRSASRRIPHVPPMDTIWKSRNCNAWITGGKFDSARNRSVSRRSHRRGISTWPARVGRQAASTDRGNRSGFRKLMLLRPQADLLVDEEGRLGMDFIGRYEHLQDSFARVCRRIGIPEQRLAVVNATAHRPWEDCCDTELRRLVARFYRRDFEMPGCPLWIPSRNAPAVRRIPRPARRG